MEVFVGGYDLVDRDLKSACQQFDSVSPNYSLFSMNRNVLKSFIPSSSSDMFMFGREVRRSS